MVDDGDASEVWGSMGKFEVFNLGEQVRLDAQWGPNSQYFVLVTTNHGDKSQQPASAYAFSMKDHTLHQIGGVSGKINYSKFTFLDSHTIRASIRFKSNSETNIDLDREVSSTPAIVPVKHGDWSQPAKNTSTH